MAVPFFNVMSKAPVVGVLAVWMLAMTGCMRSAGSDQFFMLKPIDASASLSAAPRPAALLVGMTPVRIPAYLDRPQIVTALNGHGYQVSEDNRWAERLDENVARVTLQNLSLLIPTEKIVMAPWGRDTKPDVVVGISIQEMHADAAGQARLDASWSLKSGQAGLVPHRFSCRQPASVSDYSLIVSALNGCLEKLNREIAAEIQRASR